MYFFYSVLLALGLAAASPYWLFQALRHGKYMRGLGERLGKIPARLLDGSNPRTIWFHAVSVGEVLAISKLVEGMRASFPQHRLLVSTTTDAGQKLAATRFGEENVFYFPLDFKFAVQPYLRVLKPELIVLAETEFWPNFLRLSQMNGALVAVVNARISDRSLPGYRRWKSLLSGVLQNINLFLAQTGEDKKRLIQIGAGAERVSVSGNLKFEVPAPATPPIIGILREQFARVHAGPIIVAGSTVEGEEGLLLNAFRNVLVSYPSAVMILAPRHPERFSEVAGLLAQLNMPFWRRTVWTNESLAGGVLLLDSIGELSSIYSLADIAFVGGSLVPRGGHNILEPAQHGVAIIVGNHTENFRDIVGLFESRRAIRVAGPAEFPLVLLDLLSNNADREELGKHALETVQSQMGATQRTLNALQDLMKLPRRAAAQ